MRILPNPEKLEQTKKIQQKLLEEYGIEANLCEIQEIYIYYCRCFCGCDDWLDISRNVKSCYENTTLLEDFCKYVNKRMSE